MDRMGPGTSPHTPAPKSRRDTWSWNALCMISIGAGVGFTATAEYQLARTIGASVPVAVLLPLALDVYVVAAIWRSRGLDIALSLALMGTAQVAAHVLEAGVLAVSVPLVTAVSLLVPLSIWRVHALAVLPADTAGAVPERPADPLACAPEAPPTVERAEAAPVPVPPVPAAVEGAARPELPAVQAATASPAPVRRKLSKSRRSKPGTGAAFDAHVSTAQQLLAEDPKLSGTDIGKEIGTGPSYGRRVRRAALDTAAPGPARPLNGTRR